jgi:hypothetical protein
LPDDATRLAADLVQLADKQDAALTADDWEAFLALAERREAAMADLAPLLDGRQDLLPLLRQVAEKDQQLQVRLQEVSAKVQQEIAGLRPQQMAMHAYFSGVSAADDHEARFIDQRDGR